MSTPTPPASLLHRLSGLALYSVALAAVLLPLAALALAVFYTVDWSALVPSFVQLAVIVGVLYWTTTLLPGPVKKVGRAAGKTVGRAVFKPRGKGGKK